MMTIEQETKIKTILHNLIGSNPSWKDWLDQGKIFADSCEFQKGRKDLEDEFSRNAFLADYCFTMAGEIASAMAFNSLNAL